MKNTSNTSSETTLEQEYNLQVEKLLGLEEGKFAELVSIKGKSQAISDLLDLNRKNKDFALLAIEQDGKNIEKIPDELKSHIVIASRIITSMMRSGANFLEIEKYLDQYITDKKDHKTLIKHYKRMQKVGGTLTRSDLTSYLMKIRETDFYKYLKEKKIIIGVEDYLKPREGLMKNFIRDIESLDIDELPDEEKNEKFLESITKLIGKNYGELSPEEQAVFYQILEVCIGEYNKKFTPKEARKDFDKDVEQQADSEDAYETEDDFEDYTPEEKLDYCYPTRGYSVLDNGGYSINLQKNRKLKISKEEMEKSSVAALENYAIFYETLCKFDLNFLWDKCRTGFSSACNKKFGLTPFSGEGVTTPKLLSVVNFIAINIGVPEKNPQDPDSESDPLFSRFEDISQARRVFRDIKNTGKINDEEVDSSPGTSSLGVVEKYSKSCGLIDDQYTFNSSQWG